MNCLPAKKNNFLHNQQLFSLKEFRFGFFYIFSVLNRTGRITIKYEYKYF